MGETAGALRSAAVGVSCGGSAVQALNSKAHTPATIGLSGMSMRNMLFHMSFILPGSILLNRPPLRNTHYNSRITQPMKSLWVINDVNDRLYLYLSQSFSVGVNHV
jgi:hypothetical protein